MYNRSFGCSLVKFNAFKRMRETDRSLNVFDVMPMKCLVSFVLLVLMVALYTISLFIHLFCNGHASLFLQLRVVICDD